MGLALYFVLLGAVAGYGLPFVDWIFSIEQGLARSMARFCLAAAALGLALLLPLLLESMPGWLIPARWSDFSFWGNLAARIREGLQACKYAPVYWRDIGLL